jgi:5-methylcytosine-specific restriction endonuclease McrA
MRQPRRTGCLGRLVVLAILVWSIAHLQAAWHWSDTATGGVLLVSVASFAIGVSDRRRASTHRPDAPHHRARGAHRLDRRPQPASRRREQAPAERADHRVQTPAADVGGTTRDRLPAQLRFGILQRDSFRCRYCGRPGSAAGVVLHIDHVVPLAAGGTTTEDNLLSACDRCNLGKGTRAVLPDGA